MVSVVVRRSKLNGSIRCPSSKSYTHRAIAIASLAGGKASVITNALLARDTLATLASCQALGADIKHKGTTVEVKGKHEFEPPGNVINAENSGTTIRILAAISGLVRAGYVVLTGDDSLRKRPMQPILDALEQLGVTAFSTKGDGTPPLVVKGGGIKGGSALVDGGISSQFISGLLIAGVHAKSDIDLRIKGNLVSRPYVSATLATMERFGVKIEHASDMLEYHIRPIRYRSTRFDIPSDFSTAALVMAAGALAGEKLVVKGLNFLLPQGDSQAIDIMKRMGCRVRADKAKGEVVIERTEILEGGSFDLSDTPDLLPVVSILALKARHPVTISGVAHARVKETDRIANIASELVKFGARILEFNDGLKITAPKVLRNAALEAYNDHRLFMAFSIASMLTEKSVVAGAESVDVSYPNFIADMKALGARISNAPDRE
jgi:3-phosphoshikimate 1-carboxyvinyltransferase